MEVSGRCLGCQNMAPVSASAMRRIELDSVEAYLASRKSKEIARNPDFQRAASYTYLPDAKNHSQFANSSFLSIKGSFSEVDLIASADDLQDISPPETSGWTTPDDGFPVHCRPPGHGGTIQRFHHRVRAGP